MKRAALACLTIAGAVACRRSGPSEFDAKVVEVRAWCDHMPAISIPGAVSVPNRHLIVVVDVRNDTFGKLPITLRDASIRLSGTAPQPARISLRDDSSGAATGADTVTLWPLEHRVIEFRGDGVYPEDEHGASIAVDLTLTSPADRRSVSGSGTVGVTM